MCCGDEDVSVEDSATTVLNLVVAEMYVPAVCATPLLASQTRTAESFPQVRNL